MQFNVSFKEFTIREMTLGRELFENVLQTTGIREKWYFGLEFTDVNGNKCWLNLEKKVSEQRIKVEATLQFNFRVKFFPETVEDEIIQTSTLTLFYGQVRQCRHKYNHSSPSCSCYLTLPF